MISVNKILDIAELLIRKSGASTNTIYYCLFMFHIVMPFMFILLTLIGNKTIVKYTIFLSWIIIFMFLSINGCILSKLEMRFSATDTTIIDPLLFLVNLPITYKNRYNYTIYINILVQVMALIIYYIRFIYK